MLNKIFLDKFSFLILLIPFLLITGPFLPDFILSLSCLLFLFLTIKEKNFKIYNNLFVKIFFSFWVILIFTSLISKDILLSLKSSFFYFRFGLFVIFMNYLLKKNKDFEIRFIKVCFYSIILVLISCLIEFIILRYSYLLQLYELYMSSTEFYFKLRYGDFTNQINNRVSGLFGSEGVAGSYILRLIPFFFIYSLYLLEKKRFNKKKLFLFNILFVLIAFVVLITGERAAFILLCFSFLLNFLIVKKLRYLFKYSIIASFILVSFTVYFDPILKSRIIDQTKHQLNVFSDHSKRKITELKNEKSNRKFLISELHEGHFYAAWKIFLENKIFGAGMKGYRNICYNDYNFKLDKKVICSTHPHNTLLQFLSETGIIGTMYYLTILILILFQILRNFYLVNFKNKITNYNLDVKNCLLICILVNIWPLTTSGNFFNNWLSILYYLPVVIYLKDHKLIKNEKSY